MFFVFIKRFLKKTLYINVNNKDPHKQKTMCTFLYIQKTKKIKTFIYIYKNPDNFQTARQFALRFYSQKSRHFTLYHFSWNLWKWNLFIYKKQYTLRYVTFLYTKSPTLRKKQDNLCYVLYILYGWKVWPCFQDPCI